MPALGTMTVSPGRTRISALRAAEHAGKVQAIEHGGIASLGEALLFAEQGGCAAEFAEKEKHERVAQLAQGFLGHVQRGHPDLAVGLVFLAEKTAIGGDVLVLF